MLRLGLTGGMGVGKSTVAGILESEGVKVVDTDGIARQLTETGSDVLREIAGCFGDQLIGEDGSLRRETLASLVFSDPEKRRKLESILHPRIRSKWMEFVENGVAEGWSCACVVIPLLYETGAEGAFDRIISVGCTSGTQLHRLRERSWSDDEIRGRLEAQMPGIEKMGRANHVIWTEGTLESTRKQVRMVLKRLR